jgi:hypothetical protein
MAVSQAHYRFGIDEGTESTHGWHAAQNENPAFGSIPLDTTFLLRFLCQCDATALSNVDFEFQYRKNGGAWTQISTTSNDVRAVTPTCWANAANTTNRLTGGTGTFEASSQGCTVDGISGGTAFDIVSNGFGETECAIQLRSADLVAGDFIEFRLTHDGGTLMDTYAVTPALGIPLSAVPGTESPRSFERIFGAAVGLVGALLSVGLVDTPRIRASESVQAELVTVVQNSETVKVVDDLQVVRSASDASASVDENAKADDGGFVELVGLGNPIKILDGPVSAALLDDTLSILRTENAKLADSAFAVLDLLRAAEEAVKSADGGFVELIGLGNPVRITDTLAAQLISSNLEASLLESIKGADGPTLRTLNPEQSALLESAKVADTLLGPIIDPEQTAILEEIKIADAIGATLNPEQANPAENVRISDTLAVVLDPEQADLLESTNVTDGPIAVLLSGDLAASPTENLRAADSPLTILDPEQTELSEAPKIDDGGFVELRGLGNPVKIADGPVSAALTSTVPGANASESIKVADQVSASLGLLGAVLTEGVRVADSGEVELSRDEVVRISDSVIVSIGNALATNLSESLRILDTSSTIITPEQTVVAESAKVSDNVVASLGAGIFIEEVTKVTDALTLALNPEQAVTSEQYRILEEFSVALIEAGALAASIQEQSKVADVSDQTIDPEQILNAEACKVSDAVSVVIDRVASLSESVKVADSLIASLQLAADITEIARVQDGEVSGQLSRLFVEVIESVKVDDSQFSTGSGTTLAAILSEGIKSADAQTVVLDPEEISLSDGVTVSDVLSASVNPEVIEQTEALGIVDSIDVVLTPLNVDLEENISTEDLAPRFGGPRVIRIVGGYSTTISVVGSYSGTTLNIVGGYGEGQ